MRQSILKLILHQSTPDAIVAQIECLESLASLQTADYPFNGLLAYLVALQIYHHDLGVANSSDNLSDAVVCKAILSEGQ